MKDKARIQWGQKVKLDEIRTKALLRASNDASKCDYKFN